MPLPNDQSENWFSWMVTNTLRGSVSAYLPASSASLA